MQPEKKSKLFAIKSVMDNPKLSRIIEEGYNAPIGSTKRDKAKSIVSILEKLGSSDRTNSLGVSVSKNNNKGESAYSFIYDKAFSSPAKSSADGQGGPADMSANPLFSGTSIFSGPSFLKRAPEPSQGFSSRISPKSSPVQPSSSQPSSAFQSDVSAMKDYVGGAPTAFQEALKKNVYPAGEAAFNQGYNVVKMGGSIPLAFGEYVPRAIYDYFTKPAGQGVKLKDTLGGKIISNRGSFYETGREQPAPIKTVETAKPEAAKVEGAKTDMPEGLKGTSGEAEWNKLTPEQKNEFYALPEAEKNKFISSFSSMTTTTGAPLETTETAEPSTDATTGLTTSTNPLAGTPYEASWNKLPDNVKDMILSSTTPGGFAERGMSDADALAALSPQYLQELRAMFPGVPDAQLPLASGLTGQLDALKKRLKEESQLDALANERKTLLEGDSTLVPDLTDYIKGRDTYIKDIDNMITGVKNEMKTGGSDPASVAANQGYLNYLRILKGRQNNRYIDLLNSAVTSHDNKMKNATEAYNAALKVYNDEVSSAEKMTTARYNQVYKDLSSLYELVKSGPQDAIEAAIKYQQLLKTTRENIKEAAGDKEDLDYQAEAKKYQDKVLETTGDNQGKFLTNIDLYDIASVSLNAGKSANSFITILLEGLSNATSPSEIKSTKQKIDKFISDGGEKLLEYHGYVPTDASGNKVPLATVLNAKLEVPVRKAYLSLISQNPEATKDLLNYLVGISPDKVNSKKKDFDSKASQLGIESTLSDAIWNYYVNKALKQYGSAAASKDQRKSMFSILGGAEDGEETLAGALARSN